MSSTSPSLRTMISSRQAREIGAERHQLLFLLLIERRRSQRRAGRHLPLDPLYVFKRDVPTSLELVGDQPVRWINGIVLPSSASCLVASLLQGQLVLSLGRCRL